MARCPECRGTGESACDMDYGGDSHPYGCPVCGGSNVSTCLECGGTGEVDDD